MIGDVMALPSFSETTALVTVLEERSFRNAARKLGLSPARVSELVRNLEARLGVRLVERTSRSVAASPAGERLVERLRPLFDDYREAIEELNKFRSEPAGLLRLTVAPPAADLVLAPVIGRFLSQYPQINIDVSVDRESVDIVAAGFDAGIRPGELLTRDMVCLRVSGEMPFVVVASPAYLQRCGIPKTPRELTKHACLRVRLPSGAWETWRFGKTGRALEVGIDGRLTANEPAIAVAAAVDGAGLLQIPLSYVAPELDAGRLVTVLDDWARPPVDGFFVYYPSRRHMRPPLKAFVDFLSGAYRRTPAGQKSPRRNRPAD
jgi:DNA-binding transcriptional LysR family regulator